ncbi:squalene-associated FAD-dependent desaturase [Sphaerotilus hippei]|uniref:Squalene-associated FAD-dependent desaturase n=1 Tax=Sphaerotilus hippei TaxID=744406 RepID=A0A318GYJ4_9BURK|nr:squalene-associated FAD-dependent desaturase [Sphaerotilus hippei]
MTPRVAVVGAGWAGLAAAVAATTRGHAVTLFEMAAQAGGRARSLATGEPRLDNGQHLLIGAYAATLALMRQVGVDPEAVLRRQPLALLDQDGRGLRLPAGHPVLAFSRAVWAMSHWSLGERLALSRAALGWMRARFRCEASLTVAQLSARLPSRVRAEIIDPLCVAALNTPATTASAAVFLRVLQDALFAGPGSSDLLIPRRPLAELLPEPALAWLARHGADLRAGQRVQSLQPGPAAAGWRLDDEPFDQVILACSSTEAARLTRGIAPDWSARAAGLRHEPILTAYVQAPGARLAAPMVALREGPDAPAQFAFDHGALGATPGLFALVVSGATPWVQRGPADSAAALLRQAGEVLRPLHAGGRSPAATLLQVIAEKRATFLCTPGLSRPPARIAAGLLAAGDGIDGPYPATLEGAVRSGRAAADLLAPP